MYVLCVCGGGGGGGVWTDGVNVAVDYWNITN